MAGTGGACGIIDKRFNLRASVGLIVLAPSPVAWCGSTDILLFVEEDRAPVRTQDFPGVREVLVKDEGERSGVREGDKKSLLFSRLGC